jgi:molecular chaperone DnaJ
MDLYQILGIDRDATPGEIKRVYRRLARRYHPDINPGDRAAARRFSEITRAYETLIDPERRRRYDECGLADDSPGRTTTFGFEGFDFSVEAAVGQTASTFGDLFGDVLRRAHGAQPDAPQRGADLHVTVSIGFEDAMKGAEQTVTLTRRERCRICRGMGRLERLEARCSHCGGAGTVRSARGHMVFSKPCRHCSGTGQVRQWTCPSCAGQGLEVRSEAVTVRVPPGVADGDRVRVPLKGDAGRLGGPAGDLHAEVRVAPHPLFRREGAALHLVVPVAVHEAALGTKIDVPTIDGQARMRVPPGTQSGQRFRLRERGVPLPDGTRGDQIVEVRLVLPELLDERSKELLREFGRINSEDVRKSLFG